MTLVNNIDIRIPLMMCINLLVLLFISLINEALNYFSVYFFGASLLLLVPSLFLGYGAVLFNAIFFGFYFQAFTTSTSGAIPALFLLAALCIFKVRDKFRSLDPMGLLTLSWLANIALYFACVLFVFPVGMGSYFYYTQRIFVDVLVSSALLFVLSGLIVNLHISVFYLLGINLSVPERENG